MGKFRQILMELSARDMPIFGMCIDIVEMWFGIANGQISSNFDGSYLPKSKRSSLI